MSLRTKLVLSICAFMLLVCGLVAANLLLEAADRAKAEDQHRTRLVEALVLDWVRELPDLAQPESAEALERRLRGSPLVEGWIVASRRDGNLRIVVSHPPREKIGGDADRYEAVLDHGRVIVEGRSAWVRLGGGETPWAARFELRAAYEPGIPFVGGLGGILLVMGLGTALLVLNAYVFLHRFVTRPLAALVEASRRVSEGDFSQKIPTRSTYDEMATLVAAFNLMLEKIAHHEAALKDDLRRAQKKISHTEKRLIAAQRLSATGTLAAGLAHEINNPLGGMANAVRALQAGDLPPEKRREYLALVEEGLERVSAIVQKVLQFRPKVLEPQPVGLRDVTARAISFLEHRARQKGVEVRNDLPGDLPPVQGDPLELQQAILNILINAVDACVLNEGMVTATHRLDGASIALVIADNGCGMDPEELARAGDLFFTTKDAGEGTGLGLSVAQNIVHNHGGRLELQSERGKGTTVTILLPLGRTARRPAPEPAPGAPRRP